METQAVVDDAQTAIDEHQLEGEELVGRDIEIWNSIDASSVRQGHVLEFDVIEETHKIQYESGACGWIYLPEFNWRLDANTESSSSIREDVSDSAPVDTGAAYGDTPGDAEEMVGSESPERRVEVEPDASRDLATNDVTESLDDNVPSELEESFGALSNQSNQSDANDIYESVDQAEDDLLVDISEEMDEFDDDLATSEIVQNDDTNSNEEGADQLDEEYEVIQEENEDHNNFSGDIDMSVPNEVVVGEQTETETLNSEFGETSVVAPLKTNEAANPADDIDQKHDIDELASNITDDEKQKPKEEAEAASLNPGDEKSTTESELRKRIAARLKLKRKESTNKNSTDAEATDAVNQPSSSSSASKRIRVDTKDTEAKSKSKDTEAKSLKLLSSKKDADITMNAEIHWDYKVCINAEAIDDPLGRSIVHVCKRCKLPIFKYGRHMPCTHVFCFDCAKSRKRCGWPDCNDMVEWVAKFGLEAHLYIAIDGRSFETAKNLNQYQKSLQRTQNASGLSMKPSTKVELKINSRGAPENLSRAVRAPQDSGSRSDIRQESRSDIRSENRLPTDRDRYRTNQISPPRQERHVVTRSSVYEEEPIRPFNRDREGTVDETRRDLYVSRPGRSVDVPRERGRDYRDTDLDLRNYERATDEYRRYDNAEFRQDRNVVRDRMDLHRNRGGYPDNQEGHSQDMRNQDLRYDHIYQPDHGVVAVPPGVITSGYPPRVGRTLSPPRRTVRTLSPPQFGDRERERFNDGPGWDHRAVPYHNSFPPSRDDLVYKLGPPGQTGPPRGRQLSPPQVMRSYRY